MADEAAGVPRPADLRVAPLCEMEQFEAAARLLWRVWGATTAEAQAEVISTSVLKGLALAGNYVAGAYRGGRIIGCAVGFFGADGSRPDHIHSHLTGVDRPRQNHGVGFLLKRHQREWALKRGFTSIRWTFDPLVRRNAYFNLCKLGAEISGYARNLYGVLDDGTNTGDTDRLVVEWPLESERVGRAMAGVPALAAEHLRNNNDAKTIYVPEDVAELARRDPRQVDELRESVRKQFMEFWEEGYRVVGMTRGGHYVLLPASAPAFVES